MHLKSTFTAVFFLSIIVGGCVASTPTKTDQNEKDYKTEIQEASDQLFDIVLLYNTKPEEYAGYGDREPVLRKNIDGDLEFNKKFSASNLIASHCFISNENIDEQYKIKLATQATEAARRLTVSSMSSGGIDLPITASERGCKDMRYNEVDLVTIPKYLYKDLTREDWKAGENFRPVTVFPLEEVVRLSKKLELEEAQRSIALTDLKNKYAELKSNQDDSYIGSLFLKVNTRDERYEADDEYNEGPSFYPQNVCALEKNKSIPQSIIGYRAFDREILSDHLKIQYETAERQSQSELRITGDDNKLSFFKTFSTLNDAYMYFSDLKYGHDVPGCETACGNHSDWEESCAIFVAPANEVAKLSEALADGGIQSAYGKLFSVTESNEHAAVAQGFQSHDEFKFMTEEKLITKMDQLQTLRQYEANSPEKFDGLINEIRASEYTEDNLSISVILTYLKDRQAARENNTDVLQEKKKRLAQQAERRKKQEESAAREQAEMEENFPYVATLSCEFQGNHTNIAACFSGGEYAAKTQLELTNGNSSQIYQGYELNSVGRELRSGLVIDLTKSFNMKAQNASDRLSLRLRIVERKSKKVVFEDIVSQYGVISVQN